MENGLSRSEIRRRRLERERQKQMEKSVGQHKQESDKNQLHKIEQSKRRAVLDAEREIQRRVQLFPHSRANVITIYTRAQQEQEYERLLIDFAVRTVPLGQDRHGRQYYIFFSNENERRLFVEDTAEQRRVTAPARALPSLGSPF